jgi:hypothetical protein
MKRAGRSTAERTGIRQWRAGDDAGRGVVAATLAALVVGAAVVAGMGPVGVGTAQPVGTSVDSCRTIDEPGTYALTSDLRNVTATPCIEITASNVTLAGGGHTIAGDGTDGGAEDIGVALAPGLSTLRDVTVRNLTVARLPTGVEVRGDGDITVRDVVARDTVRGLTDDATGTTVRNVTVEEATFGLELRGQGTVVRDVTLRRVGDEVNGVGTFVPGDRVDIAGVTAVDGRTGLEVSGGANVSVRDVRVDNASEFGVQFDFQPRDGTVRNVTVTDSRIGLALGGDNNTVANVTVRNGSRGVQVESGAGNRLRALRVDGVRRGLEVTAGRDATVDTTISDVRVRDAAFYGIRIARGAARTVVENASVAADQISAYDVSNAPDSRLVNATLRGDAPPLAVGGTDNVTVRAVDIGASTAPNATLTGRLSNVTVDRIDPGAPPAPPEGTVDVDRYLAVTFDDSSFSSDGSVRVSVGYPSTAAASVNESRLGLWAYDGTTWTELGGTPDPANRTVTGRVTATDIGTGQVTVAPLATVPTANLTVETLDTDAPVTGGDRLRANATLGNVGDAAANRTVKLAVDGIVVDTTRAQVSAGATGTVAFDWNTTRSDAGSRTLSVRTGDDTASTTVEVRTPATLSPSIRTAPRAVVEGEPLTVNATVTNTGDVAGSGEVRLVTNPGGLVEPVPTGDGGAVSTAETVRDVTTVSLGPGETTSVELTWQTVAGDAGSYRIAVVSDTAPPPEGRRVEVRDLVPLNLTVNRSTVAPGEPVGFVVRRADTGGRLPATVTVNGTEVFAGAETAATYRFGSPGTYDAVATRSGERIVYGRDTETVRVTDGTDPVAGPFAVNLTGANASVTAGDPLEAAATVENTGTATGTTTVSLVVGGQVRDDRTVQLNASESRTVGLTWGTTAGDAGTYDLRAETDDDASGTRSVTVGPRTRSGSVTVTDFVGPSRTYLGRNGSVPAYVIVRNDGNTTARNRTVAYRVDTNRDGRLTDNETVTTRTVTLAPGESRNLTVQLDVDALSVTNRTYDHGGAADGTVESESIAVVWNPFPNGVPGVPGDLPPRDYNDDGQYEDIDGDGEFVFYDVIQLMFALDGLERLTGPQLRALNFEDNDSTVDIVDVIELVFRV